MRALGLLLVLCLLLFAEQSFLVAANLTSVSVPENPDKSQPILTIANLRNDSTLNVTSLTFSFTVQKPPSWFNYYPVHGDLISINYILDGKMTEVASKGLDNNHDSTNPLTYTVTIPELSDGNHSLQVYVHSVSYYLDPNRPGPGIGYGWWMYPPANYFMDTYSKINFAVDTTPASPTPIPMISTPTVTPYQPPIDRNAPHLDPIYYLIPVSIIVGIVILSLLLYRKHRKTINQNKPNV
jgi:hypothetical protein